MAVPLAPHAHKVRLVHPATGEIIERWPVDARELVATGDYAVAPEQAASTPAAAPLAGDDPLRERVGAIPAAPSVPMAPAGAVPGLPADPPVDPPVDPMPHVTQAAARTGALSPTGAPLVIAPASGVTQAAPANIPAGGSNARVATPAAPASPVPAGPRGKR